MILPENLAGSSRSQDGSVGRNPALPTRACGDMPAFCDDNGVDAISCREPSRFFLLDRATEPRVPAEICAGAVLMAAKRQRVARRNQRRWRRLAPWATGWKSATNMYRS
jgi:hypothetical protein